MGVSGQLCALVAVLSVKTWLHAPVAVLRVKTWLHAPVAVLSVKSGLRAPVAVLRIKTWLHAPVAVLSVKTGLCAPVAVLRVKTWYWMRRRLGDVQSRSGAFEEQRNNRSVFWEVVLSFIVIKLENFIWTCVRFWMVTMIELFESTNIKASYVVVIKHKFIYK